MFTVSPNIARETLADFIEKGRVSIGMNGGNQRGLIETSPLGSWRRHCPH